MNTLQTFVVIGLPILGLLIAGGAILLTRRSHDHLMRTQANEEAERERAAIAQ